MTLCGAVVVFIKVASPRSPIFTMPSEPLMKMLSPWQAIVSSSACRACGQPDVHTRQWWSQVGISISQFAACLSWSACQALPDDSPHSDLPFTRLPDEQAAPCYLARACFRTSIDVYRTLTFKSLHPTPDWAGLKQDGPGGLSQHAARAVHWATHRWMMGGLWPCRYTRPHKICQAHRLSTSASMCLWRLRYLLSQQLSACAALRCTLVGWPLSWQVLASSSWCNPKSWRSALLAACYAKNDSSWAAPLLLFQAGGAGLTVAGCQRWRARWWSWCGSSWDPSRNRRTSLCFCAWAAWEPLSLRTTSPARPCWLWAHSYVLGSKPPPWPQPHRRLYIRSWTSLVPERCPTAARVQSDGTKTTAELNLQPVSFSLSPANSLGSTASMWLSISTTLCKADCAKPTGPTLQYRPLGSDSTGGSGSTSSSWSIVVSLHSLPELPCPSKLKDLTPLADASRARRDAWQPHETSWIPTTPPPPWGLRTSGFPQDAVSFTVPSWPTQGCWRSPWQLITVGAEVLEESGPHDGQSDLTAVHLSRLAQGVCKQPKGGKEQLMGSSPDLRPHPQAQCTAATLRRLLEVQQLRCTEVCWVLAVADTLSSLQACRKSIKCAGRSSTYPPPQGRFASVLSVDQQGCRPCRCCRQVPQDWLAAFVSTEQCPADWWAAHGADIWMVRWPCLQSTFGRIPSKMPTLLASLGTPALPRRRERWMCGMPRDLSYDDFVSKYMSTNTPVLITVRFLAMIAQEMGPWQEEPLCCMCTLRFKGVRAACLNAALRLLSQEELSCTAVICMVHKEEDRTLAAGQAGQTRKRRTGEMLGTFGSRTQW